MILEQRITSLREVPMLTRNRIAALAFLAALAIPGGAQAQLFRAYLSPDGNDANPCNLPQPCRLLPAALAAVASGGEIWMLDSANYNTSTVTIGKSVSILAVPGAVGSLVAVSGPAISITTGGLKISLRNVVIVGLVGGGGTEGINMSAASELTVEESVIANLTSSDGIYVAGAGRLAVSNSTFRNIVGGYAGVHLRNNASGAVTRSTFANNDVAMYVSSDTSSLTVGTVSDSTISGGGAGVVSYSTVAGALAYALVSRCTIEGLTNAAVYAESFNVAAPAEVGISGNLISKNGKSWYQSGSAAVVRTMGNNHFAVNGSPTGSLTTGTLQ
jgi:hypothetical protein